MFIRKIIIVVLSVTYLSLFLTAPAFAHQSPKIAQAFIIAGKQYNAQFDEHGLSCVIDLSKAKDTDTITAGRIIINASSPNKTVELTVSNLSDYPLLQLFGFDKVWTLNTGINNFNLVTFLNEHGYHGSKGVSLATVKSLLDWNHDNRLVFKGTLDDHTRTCTRVSNVTLLVLLPH